MILGSCFGNQNYDIILYRKPELTLDEVYENSSFKLKGNLANVKYFAFEMPKHENKNPENEFDTWEYSFPDTVKVYTKNKEFKWIYLKSVYI